jgi:hypothetical protein
MLIDFVYDSCFFFQDKVGVAVGNLKTPIDTISTNVAAHHTSHHTTRNKVRDVLHHHTDHDHHDHDEGSGHHGHHEPSAFSYTPVVRIIANRTTNLIPVQSGNVQADGSADSAATSSDQNNPTEGGSKCDSSFLGSILCNLQLGIGRTADRRIDDTDVYEDEDTPVGRIIANQTTNLKPVKEEDEERVNGTDLDREPRLLGRREKEFEFNPLAGIFDFLLDVVLGPKKPKGNLNMDLSTEY